MHRKPLNGMLANNEDADEMSQYATFHQCLHYLLKLKNYLRTDGHIYIKF